jgi:hypothetical protein
MKIVIRFFLGLLTPFIKWTASIYAPYSRKKITGKHYYIYRDLIEVGTVFLTKTNGELSNLINPVNKNIKHGALYVGYIEGIPTVIEAVGKGVIFTDLVTFLTSKDKVIGLKPDFITQDDKIHIGVEAQKRIGLAYDYFFNTNNNAYYCFELIVDIFKSIKPNVILKSVEIIKNYRIYDESTFLEDDRFFKIFDSKDIENE